MNYKNQAFAKLFFLYILAFYIFVPVDLCLLRDFVLNDTFCVLHSLRCYFHRILIRVIRSDSLTFFLIAEE